MNDDRLFKTRSSFQMTVFTISCLLRASVTLFVTCTRHATDTVYIDVRRLKSQQKKRPDQKC